MVLLALALSFLACQPYKRSTGMVLEIEDTLSCLHKLNSRLFVDTIVSHTLVDTIRSLFARDALRCDRREFTERTHSEAIWM
jgi:hypothetical protein